VAAYKAYNVYDTVSTSVDNFNTVTDPTASLGEKAAAVADSASALVGAPKFLRNITGKLGSKFKNRNNNATANNSATVGDKKQSAANSSDKETDKKGESKEEIAKKGTPQKTEIVERAMTKAELEHLKDKGTLRFGKSDETFVTDNVNTDVKRARQRLALPKEPEVRVKIEVEAGKFSKPTKVEPFELPDSGGKVLPGGGTERVAEGVIRAKIIEVNEF